MTLQELRYLVALADTKQAYPYFQTLKNITDMLSTNLLEGVSAVARHNNQRTSL